MYNHMPPKKTYQLRRGSSKGSSYTLQSDYMSYIVNIINSLSLVARNRLDTDVEYFEIRMLKSKIF